MVVSGFVRKQARACDAQESDGFDDEQVPLVCFRRGLGSGFGHGGGGFQVGKRRDCEFALPQCVANGLSLHSANMLVL
jgi:hypothetical protein